MPHPLQTEMAAIRGRVRKLTLLYGVSWVFALATIAAGLLGLADYLIRFQDPGIRVICSLLVAGVAGAAVYKYLLKPLAQPLGDLAIAQRLERHFPELQERLSSAIEFLRQPVDDPRAGSADLRRAVIAQTTDEVGQLNLRAALDQRPPTRALLAACGVLLAVMALCLADGASVRIAVARLMNPVGSTTWPKQNSLAFKQAPTRLALGQPFEVEVVDRNDRLPRDVRIHYRRMVDGAAIESREAMQFAGAGVVARIDKVSHPFEYRATGGDDDSMPWTKLDVVEPPSIESFDVTLQPPAYTGLSAAKSEKRIRALRGTQVGIRGTVTKPLAAARLLFESGEEISAKLSADGHQFTIAASDFTIDKSGAYWFALEDAEGLTGGEDSRWEIRAIPDSPPTVAIEQPATNIFVTPEAVVRLKVLAKDNLAIRDVVLRYGRTDKSGEGDFEIRLYQGPERIVANTNASAGDGEAGESRVAEFDWKLAELGLASGAQLTLVALASDYLPQEGASVGVRRISVISAVELEDRLAQQQAAILAELARVLKVQRESRGQTAALDVQLNEVGALGKRDIDGLQAAELNQRQVDRSLGDAPDAVPAHVRALLHDLASNQVDSPDIERRMNDLVAELDRLNQEPLPIVRRELTAALKSAQAQLEAPGEPVAAAVRKSLSAAATGQDEVIQALERLLGDLSEWSDYRRFARDVRQIQQDQEEVTKATGGLGTLTQDLKDLNSQQRAELKKTALAQLELARRLDKTLQGMREMGGELSQKDPLASATLDDALHHAQQAAIAGQMRQAGDHVEQNQVGQAAESQAQVNARLQEMLDILANRREHQLSRRVAKLREAEQELATLRERQQGLRKKIREAAEKADAEERSRELQRLTKQQQELQEELDRMARQLKRLQADKAARSTERGANEVGQASKADTGGDAEQAGEHANKAKHDLDDAQQQLAEARRQAESDLAREQLARFEDAIRGLVARQQQIVDRTVEQHQASAAQSARTRASALQDLSRLQTMLQEDTAQQARGITEAQTFRMALDSAATDMAHAVTGLEQRETGPFVQRWQRSALGRLALLLKAFDEDQNQQQKAEDEQGGGGEGGEGGQRLRNLAELKLVKLLQEDVNRRTAELDEQVGDAGNATEEQLADFARLSEEQGKLAEVVFDLLQPDSKATDQDTPENLPDIRGEKPAGDDLPPLNLEETP